MKYGWWDLNAPDVFRAGFASIDECKADASAQLKTAPWLTVLSIQIAECKRVNIGEAARSALTVDDVVELMEERSEVGYCFDSPVFSVPDRWKADAERDLRAAILGWADMYVHCDSWMIGAEVERCQLIANPAALGAEP
jgi:hypothetical protein